MAIDESTTKLPRRKITPEEMREAWLFYQASLQQEQDNEDDEEEPKHRWTGLFDRDILDELRPKVMIMFAVLFIALSSVSIIMKTGSLLAMGNIHLPTALTVAIGVIVAVIVSVGEIFASESPWYYAFLLPDIAFTCWWTWPALMSWFGPLGGWPAALAAGAMLATISAWLPEHVAFGNRRRKQKQSMLRIKPSRKRVTI